MNRGSGGAGDVLVLNEDGTVTIGWDGLDSTATLRRPNAGEWLSFMEEIEAADLWARGEDPAEERDDAVPPVKKSQTEAIADGRYLRLYARMLAELADVVVEPKELPPWLGVGGAAARISQWWVTNPLHRTEVAAVTRTLTQ